MKGHLDPPMTREDAGRLLRAVMAELDRMVAKEEGYRALFRLWSPGEGEEPGVPAESALARVKGVQDGPDSEVRCLLAAAGARGAADLAWRMRRWIREFMEAHELFDDGERQAAVPGNVLEVDFGASSGKGAGGGSRKSLAKPEGAA